jgi:hypothetical protein
VDRPYQHEAIRRVAEAFAAGRRRALLVMATGTGKTRTTLGLIDIFLRSSTAQKVLFLADRDALVGQALNDGFQVYLPNEPRARIHTADIDPDKRLYVATLQTLSRCFEKFSPGFFDLIVFDEAHRSIFNRSTRSKGAGARSTRIAAWKVSRFTSTRRSRPVGCPHAAGLCSHVTEFHRFPPTLYFVRPRTKIRFANDDKTEDIGRPGDTPHFIVVSIRRKNSARCDYDRERTEATTQRRLCPRGSRAGGIRLSDRPHR